MYLFKVKNIFVEIKTAGGLNCLPKKLIKNLLPLTLSENCPYVQMYLSKLQKVFVQSTNIYLSKEKNGGWIKLSAKEVN